MTTAKDDLLHIRADTGLAAVIDPFGAELAALRDADGVDLLWNGDPAVWSGRAPILFPFVGGLKDDRYHLAGRAFPTPRHGFARRSAFAVVARSAASVSLRLAANEATRTAYPFAFALTLTYTIAGSQLRITAEIANHGDVPMPASFGFHPAFRWPLVPGAGRGGHTITFAEDEAATMARLDGAGLVAEAVASPLAGRVLALDDALFAHDALIFPGVRSRSVTYGGPAGPRLTIDFPGFPDLGIWSKPGAGFVCIEPWQGHADPAGFSGDVFEKPGILRIDPGALWSETMTVTVAPD